MDNPKFTFEPFTIGYSADEEMEGNYDLPPLGFGYNVYCEGTHVGVISYRHDTSLLEVSYGGECILSEDMNVLNRAMEVLTKHLSHSDGIEPTCT